MDFSFDNTLPDTYIHWIRLAEEETSQTFYNKMWFLFLELPDFNVSEKNIKTDLERWMYVLRNMDKFQKIPVILRKKVFQKLFQISEVSNLTKEEYMLYEKNLMDKWDAYSVLKTAEEKGIEKGAEQKSYELVQNLLSHTSFGIAKIAALANVTEGFVKRVKKGEIKL